MGYGSLSNVRWTEDHTVMHLEIQVSSADSIQRLQESRGYKQLRLHKKDKNSTVNHGKIATDNKSCKWNVEDNWL